MVLFHFLYSSIFLMERHPFLSFSDISAGVICNPSYLLIYFVWPLILGFFSFFCLSLISSCGSPQWTSFTISLLHALPIALSVLFYSSISLESTCTSITLYVYLFALPSPCTLVSASNLSFFFAPISSPPWDRSPTSWKSHQHCIALNNS